MRHYVLLSAAALLGADASDVALIASVSAAAGLVAAQLWGPVAALVAMSLAAVYVPLVTMSGTVMFNENTSEEWSAKRAAAKQ